VRTYPCLRKKEHLPRALSVPLRGLDIVNLIVVLILYIRILYIRFGACSRGYSRQRPAES